jgi:probable FeS assembly SUF system protein SufT
MEREEIVFARETEVIQIPDGTPIFVPEGTGGWIMQLLGGNFTVRLETGHLVRVAGQDASAIGKEIPVDAAEPDLDAEFDEEQIWDQLRTCYDPEIPVNIVDLGLIYGFDVDDNEDGRVVNVTMTLTAPGCGMGQVLKDDVETKVSALAGVKDAIVELVFDPPWSPERMSEAAQLELGFL